MKIHSMQFLLLVPVSLFFTLGSIVFALYLFEKPTVQAEENTSISVQAAMPTGNLNSHSCLANYGSFKKSYTANPHSKWSTIGFETQASNNLQGLYDVNGDGLLDYLYVQHNDAGNYIYDFNCVMLNNGNGWDIAYKCVVVAENSFTANVRPVYYGDCAL